MTAPGGSAARDTRFFGHPLGLGILAGTELWERFSFYGMQAILMLYMTKHLLAPDVAPKVLGLAAFRGFFEPITDVAFAAQTFGIYSGLIYATPLAGAWIADRWLGRTRTITIGALMMSAGHVTMASESLFLIALSLIIMGSGLVIGNMAAQVGALYPPDDERRTRAFAIYLMALNVGGLLSPLIVGTLGEKVGWHWGFGAAGVGMILGLTTYLAGRRHLPPDMRIARSQRRPLTPRERRTILGILMLLAPVILAFAAFQQAYGLMLLWADKAVAHSILGWNVPITWMLFLDGIMTIGGCVLAGAIWKRLAERGREPTDIVKIGIGCAMLATAFLYIGMVAQLSAIPLVLLILFYAIVDLSTCWFDPPTTSTISRTAPPQLNATMIAFYKLSISLAFFLLGWLARFYEPLGPSLYWAMTALLPLTGLALILLFGSRVSGMLDPADDRPVRNRSDG